MDNGSSNRSIISLLQQLLVGVVIAVGLSLTIVSFFVQEGDAREVVRGIGLALFPAGVVALLVSRFAATITQELLREAVERTIGQLLQDALKGIEQAINGGLADIDEDMKRLSPLFISASKLGLQNVYLTRLEAWDGFVSFLEAEAQRAERGGPARLWIVSSSMLGVLEAASDRFDGRKMMKKILDCRCDLRIMMTDPEMADVRAGQEERAQGDIPREIWGALGYLKRNGLARTAVKFYPGTPTVFAVATTDRMLLNPYPYQAEAFRSFSLLVYKTLGPDTGIFDQYMDSHFEGPWARARDITPAEWNKLK
jgi:hypothetical protein